MSNNGSNTPNEEIIGTYRPQYKDKDGNIRELPLDAETVRGIDVTDTANLINGAGFISTPIPEAPKIQGIWRLICQVSADGQIYTWVIDRELNWHVLKLDNTWPLR